MPRRATPKAAPQSLASRPVRPARIVGTARKFWDLIVPMLHQMGYLVKIDRIALELMCDSYVIYHDIQKQISGDTVVTKTEKGNLVQHPLISARNSAYKQLVGMMNEFGMTPAARVKMTSTPLVNPQQIPIPLNPKNKKPTAGEVPEYIQQQLGGSGKVGHA